MSVGSRSGISRRHEDLEIGAPGKGRRRIVRKVHQPLQNERKLACHFQLILAARIDRTVDDVVFSGQTRGGAAQGSK